MQRHYLALILLVAGCKKSREQSCDELAKLGIALADELGKQLGDKGKKLGSDPEIKAKMAEFKQQCMQWPQEVFDCIQANDETSVKCKAAMAHITGLVPSEVSKAPPGPPVVATAKLGEQGWDRMPVSLAADGTLIAAPKEAITSFDATGKERWRIEMRHDGWLVVENGLVFAGDRDKHEFIALDAATGTAKWHVIVPEAPGDGDRATEGAVRVGAKLFVPLADGRILRVDPAACAKPKQSGCIDLAFELTGETFDKPHLLALGDDLLLAEETAIRRFSTSGKLLAWIHVHDDLGGVAVGPGERVAAVMDDELVLFDFAHCSSSAAMELPRKSGRMYIRGEGECAGCAPPPASCLVARSEISDVDSQSPMVLRDDSVMISNMDGPVRAAINGNKHWAAEADSIGPLREAGDVVVFISRDEDEKPIRVVALDIATGKAKWARALDGIRSSDVSSTTEPIIEAAGPWLVAGAKGAVSWIKLR